MLEATDTKAQPGADETVIGQVTLTYADRFRRRVKLTTDEGNDFMLMLEQVTQLEDGAFLVTADGLIRIEAAKEEVLEIRCTDARHATSIAWHLGNRHLPLQIVGDLHLRIAFDAVIRDMLVKLGAQVHEVTAPFSPEGGAYGSGPTYGHSH